MHHHRPASNHYFKQSKKENNTWDVKVGGSGVQGHTQLYIKLGGQPEAKQKGGTRNTDGL